MSVLELLGIEEKRIKRGEITQHASGYQPLIRKVDLLMGELKTLKNASLLRSKTTLCPERKNITRWGSILKMLVKWLLLRDPVNQITTWPENIVDKIPTHTENQQITALVEDLKCFESVSKMLQTGGAAQMDMYDSKTLLDGLVNDFGDKYLLSSLRPNAPIINDPDFESGIAKIQGGAEATMTSREKRACSRFLKDGALEVTMNSPVQELGYADRILQAGLQNKKARIEKSKYRPTKHVTTQSNICERLFSQAKLIMSVLRKKMDPSTLNMLLLLKANKKLWPDASIIQKILNDRKANGVNDDAEDKLADEVEDSDDNEY